MLAVLRGFHNHPSVRHLEGHSYASKLSYEENALLVDMSKSMARPKDILVTLKKKAILNTSTMRTIYNARTKYKMQGKARRSQMQFLLHQLRKQNYMEWHRSLETTDTLIDLFWAHRLSVELLVAFLRVLIIDCIYKTNRYRLSLLEIVGVLSTHMTFSIAFVYLQSEMKDNYTWALSRARNIMEDHDVLLDVIITDRELGLMNAIQQVFPTARHMLCRWHISKNVLAKCKKLFQKNKMWEAFNSMFIVIVLSTTEETYFENLNALKRQLSGYLDALNYVLSSSLQPYMERAESAHAKLKIQLKCSTMNFETSWLQVYNLIELQHTKIKASFKKCATSVMHNLKGVELKELQGLISITALENIVGQIRRAKSIGINVATCGCEN